MSLMNRLPLSGNEGAGKAPTSVRNTLEAICADASLHARLLNTLSLLEHIGSRKIMLARSEAADADVLRHLAEETRHAYFFKRAAERVAGRALNYGTVHTLAGACARFYMGRLDARITAALRGRHRSLPYRYMSLVIEDRAIWTYRIYQQALAASHCGISLNAVLAEESQHLKSMLEQVRALDSDAEKHIAAFCAMEHREFERLWNAITSDCAALRAAAE